MQRDRLAEVARDGFVLPCQEGTPSGRLAKQVGESVHGDCPRSSDQPLARSAKEACASLRTEKREKLRPLNKKRAGPTPSVRSARQVEECCGVNVSKESMLCVFSYAPAWLRNHVLAQVNGASEKAHTPCETVLPVHVFCPGGRKRDRSLRHLAPAHVDMADPQGQEGEEGEWGQLLRAATVLAKLLTTVTIWFSCIVSSMRRSLSARPESKR
jgi:hypothetical protein